MISPSGASIRKWQHLVLKNRRLSLLLALLTQQLPGMGEHRVPLSVVRMPSC